jgi:hypothetical protein
MGALNSSIIDERGPGKLRREGSYDWKEMKIFISYAKSDTDFALSLTAQLTRQGHQVWTADRTLLPGDNWPLAIGKALQDCDAMVVLLSPNSARSEGQRYEIDFALSSDRYAGRVIPVFIRPTKNYPWILEKFSAVNADNNPAAAGRKIGQLLRKVS